MRVFFTIIFSLALTTLFAQNNWLITNKHRYTIKNPKTWSVGEDSDVGEILISAPISKQFKGKKHIATIVTVAVRRQHYNELDSLGLEYELRIFNSESINDVRIIEKGKKQFQGSNALFYKCEAEVAGFAVGWDILLFQNDNVSYEVSTTYQLNENKKIIKEGNKILETFLFTSRIKNDEVKANTSNIADSIKKWLPAGQHTADIMNGYNPRAVHLSEKLSKSVADKEEWFMEFVKEIPEGGKMPFHENLGLSENEFNEMMNLLEDVEVFSSEQAKFEVFYNEDTLFFKSSAPILKMLNYIAIDLKSNVVNLIVPNQGTLSLSYKKSIRIDSDDHAYKSTWHGYKWAYENGTENIDINNINKVADIPDFTRFLFTLGQMDKDKRIFLEFTVQGMANGEKIAGNELPLLIK